MRSKLESPGERKWPIERERITEDNPPAFARSVDLIRGWETHGWAEIDDVRRLVGADFKAELIYNPPTGELFDPATELKAIRNCPKEERAARSAEFRENSRRQARAWAACRAHIEKLVRVEPDMPRENMQAIIRRWSEAYGFGPEQEKLADDVIEEYVARRKQAKDFLASASNKQKVIQELTGVEFPPQAAEKFEIDLGLVSINVIADNDSVQYMYRGSLAPIKGPRCLGFQNQAENGILYAVSAKNSGSTIETKAHEGQHVVDKLFQKAGVWKVEKKSYRDGKDNKGRFNNRFFTVFKGWLREKFFEKIGIRTSDGSRSKTRQALEIYFRAERDLALQRAKTEIFSYLRGMLADEKYLTRLSLDVIGILEKSRDQGGLYEYLRREKTIHSSAPKLNALYNGLASEILDVGYKAIVRRAFASIQDLVHIQRFSLDQAIALLTPEPLGRWPRIVQDQYEHYLDLKARSKNVGGQ